MDNKQKLTGQHPSGQLVLNTNDLQSIEIPTQLFYVQIDPSLTEVPMESRAIPLNMSQSDHFLVPVVKDKDEQDQVCVYVESAAVAGSSFLNYIDNQKCYTVNGNTFTVHNRINIEPTACTSTTVLADPQDLSEKCNQQDVDGSPNQKYVGLVETVAENNRSKEKKPIKGFLHVTDRVVPARAYAVLPPALHFRRDCISPRRALPQRVRFGPVQGVNHTISLSAAHDLVLDAAKSNKPIFLLRNNDVVTHIDTSDKDKSNWFGLLPLGTQDTANVWLYEEDNILYGITVCSIAARTPLALGYSKPYKEEHCIPDDQPVLDMSEDLTETLRKWWCYECQRAFVALSLLQRHIDQFHSDDLTVRRRYRCQHCTFTFARLSTLKRHMARYCYKNKKKCVKDTPNKTMPVEDTLNTSLNIEDNRLPSDESLQNYTNGIDFSTSLFDTDRMPGLDISGSSRSETEFNPYEIPYRDESTLTSVLGFDSNELCKLPSVTNETSEQTQTPNESMLISCPYCKQKIIREKKRQHLSECPEKRLECVCGRIFANSEKLAEHVYAEHSSTIQSKPDLVKPNNSEYKCEKCSHTFKRRGMLVNHLWRVHGSRAPVPLERRVRHYPCAGCPKLYRTAAKRDAHQLLHHPGAVARYEIEGGRRSVAPAVCPACLRQYVTRAKLLQHIRQRHPEMAAPVKQSSKENTACQNISTQSAA